MSTALPLLKAVRHPGRIRASDLIERNIEHFAPFKSPDAALIAGLGQLNGREVLLFAQQKPKGRDAEQAASVNYGMMTAVGYWFVIEKLAESAEARRPVVTLIDTPGADPSKLGVERLLAWAISSCIASFLRYPGPSLSVVIGEGGSGGALALQVADQRLMASDGIYSVISPESCSAIIFRDSEHIQEALAILRPTAAEVLQAGAIDVVVPWTDEMAIKDHDRAAGVLKEVMVQQLEVACKVADEVRLKQRAQVLFKCGHLLSPGSAKKPSAKRITSSPSDGPRVRKFVTVGSGDDALSSLQHAYFARGGTANTAPGPKLLCPRNADGCGTVFAEEAFVEAGWACPHCGRAERIGSKEWLRLLCDADTFEEIFPDLDLSDLDHAGYDSPDYRRRRQEAAKEAGVSESLRVGVAEIEGRRCAVAVSDFSYLGGTLGAVAGEKLRAICELARLERLPLIAVTSSGGVRMFDGTLGLMQMAKANAAVLQLMQSDLPYISILADPCTGGALGSYGTWATAILAEPRALLAFAGPRVMELAGMAVDRRAMLAEQLAKYGGVDEIVPRSRMKSRLVRYLDMTAASGESVRNSSALPAAALRARDTRQWFTGFTARLSGLLEEAHEIFTATSSSYVVQANVVARLSDLAMVTVPSLLRQACSSQDHRVRANALEALGRFPTPEREQFYRGLDDTNHRVRANAAIGLLSEEPTNEEALTAVRMLCKAEDPIPRRAGLFVITRCPVESLKPAAQEMCGDRDATVRLAAALACFAVGDTARGRRTLEESAKVMGSYGLRVARRWLRFLSFSTTPALRETLDRLAATIKDE